MQFGLYILFPIGYMYYFGTNLEERFTVPDFWPKEGQTHKIPYEKDEIQSELARLKRAFSQIHVRLDPKCLEISTYP